MKKVLVVENTLVGQMANGEGGVEHCVVLSRLFQQVVLGFVRERGDFCRRTWLTEVIAAVKKMSKTTN